MTATQKTPTTGTIKWFDIGKGYGFIDTGRGDVFAHASQFSDGYDPRAGDNVKFFVGLGKDGRQSARRIVKLESATP